MHKNSEINLNEQPSVQEPSENNSMEQQRQNIDTDMIESGSDAMIVKSNENNSLIQVESLPEVQAAANRERKERIPWTAEEHRLFLQGLNKHGRGRGCWKDISKDFVPGRTPTQIASHAQKYFKHQKEVAGKKREKRSIHDINVDNNVTLVGLPSEQQIEIPSIEQQNKISPLVTHPNEQQNENISPHSTTLNDNNSGNLVTPSIVPFQEMQGQLKVEYRMTFDISPQDMKNVVKVCDLLEKNLKS